MQTLWRQEANKWLAARSPVHKLALPPTPDDKWKRFSGRQANLWPLGLELASALRTSVAGA